MELLHEYHPGQTDSQPNRFALRWTTTGSKVYGKDGKLSSELLTCPSPVHYSVYSIGGTMIEQGYLTASTHLQNAIKRYLHCTGRQCCIQDTYVVFVL